MKKMNQYTDYAIKSILTLCGIPSPSGFTREITNYLCTELKSLGLDPEQTN